MKRLGDETMRIIFGDPTASKRRTLFRSTAVLCVICLAGLVPAFMVLDGLRFGIVASVLLAKAAFFGWQLRVMYHWRVANNEW